MKEKEPPQKVNKEGFRKKLKELSKQKGVNFEKIADHLGMKTQSFQGTFRYKNTRIETLQKLADFFEVSIGKMIEFSKLPDNEEIQDLSIVMDGETEWEKPQPINPTIMQELEFYKKQNKTLERSNELLEEKVLRLEKELKQCQEGNRVHTHI